MSEHKTYIATNPKCGHIVVAMVNNPEHAGDVAKEIRKCIKWGYEVTLVESEWFRQHGKLCDCRQESKSRKTKKETEPTLF